jgi:hypothetical protein
MIHPSMHHHMMMVVVVVVVVWRLGWERRLTL